MSSRRRRCRNGHERQRDVHDHCAEHFEVRSGRIAFLIGDEQRLLEAGEQLTVPPGTWHGWWNPDDDEVLTRVRVEPSHRAALQTAARPRAEADVPAARGIRSATWP
jgi:mannose-6-phosphate isomerase-like protein (cupin superfamily)